MADQSIMRSGLDLLAATRSRRYATPAIRGPAVRWSTTRATAASLRLSTGCPERRRGATPNPLAASRVPPTGRQEGARFGGPYLLTPATFDRPQAPRGGWLPCCGGRNRPSPRSHHSPRAPRAPIKSAREPRLDDGAAADRRPSRRQVLQTSGSRPVWTRSVARRYGKIVSAARAGDRRSTPSRLRVAAHSPRAGARIAIGRSVTAPGARTAQLRATSRPRSRRPRRRAGRAGAKPQHRTG